MVHSRSRARLPRVGEQVSRALVLVAICGAISLGPVVGRALAQEPQGVPEAPVQVDPGAGGGGGAGVSHGISDSNVLRDVLPEHFFRISFLDLALWQWLAILVLFFLASILGYVVARIVVGLAKSLVSRTETDLDDVILADAAGPLRWVATIFIFYIGSGLLGLTESAGNVITLICKVGAVLAVTWFLLRLVDLFGDIVRRRLDQRDPSVASTLVPMGRRITKIFLFLVAVLSLLQNLGFNIAGLIAGLGVGGLAIALAAQKTVENFFGGVVVIADRPVKVGDFCRVGEHIGTVEDIGLRSTRIRTLDRTLLTISNAEFSTSRIENYGKRDKIFLHPTLQFGYDTSPDQMRYLLVEIRKMLYSHPRVLADPCRVRFINFGAYSLDMEIFAYVETKDWSDFLAVREDLFLRIMDIVEASGSYFAYPSQTLYLARDPGRNLDHTKEAEKIVGGWRERNEILLPNFPPEKITEIDDSLEYPPAGYVARKDA